MKPENTTMMKPHCCPYCGHEHDAATCIHEQAIPKDGDYSICIECGEVSKFTSEQGLKKIDDVERFELFCDSKYGQSAMEAVEMIKRRAGR